jgi:hypothetical protein
MTHMTLMTHMTHMTFAFESGTKLLLAIPANLKHIL